MHLRANPVPNSPQEVCPPLTGTAIPEVTLTGADGTAFDLKSAISHKPTVLVFYRGGW